MIFKNIVYLFNKYLLNCLLGGRGWRYSSELFEGICYIEEGGKTNKYVSGDKCCATIGRGKERREKRKEKKEK